MSIHLEKNEKVDIMDIETAFFRLTPVHLQNGGAEATFFRPISVQTELGIESFPPDTRSLDGLTEAIDIISFPEHTRSVVTRSQLFSVIFCPYFNYITFRLIILFN